MGYHIWLQGNYIKETFRQNNPLHRQSFLWLHVGSQPVYSRQNFEHFHFRIVLYSGNEQPEWQRSHAVSYQQTFQVAHSNQRNPFKCQGFNAVGLYLHTGPQGPEIQRQCSTSHVCCMLCVIFHLSHVTCHMSHVICHMASLFPKFQSW